MCVNVVNTGGVHRAAVRNCVRLVRLERHC